MRKNILFKEICKILATLETLVHFVALQGVLFRRGINGFLSGLDG